MATEVLTELVSVKNSCLASYLQEGMLFHYRAGVRPGVDITQIMGRLEEPIDPEDFERAWQWCLARHEILRTRFLWEGLPEPRQEVQNVVHLRLDREDWRLL